jgi:CubicO group peptidase (beta-lactamase class C family)
MMLVEEGKLDLAAPVHQYLPELKHMMVSPVETKIQ